MWAGCIWVPIYEVMTRKHLTLVTLEENLEMAADIGIDATTSLDEAFAEAHGAHGPDAKVIVLPYARYQLPREHGAHGRGADAVSGGGAARTDAARVSGARRARHVRGRAGVAGDPGLDDDRRAPAQYPGRRGGAADVAAQLAVRALRRRVPRAADDGGEAAPNAIRARCSRRSARSRAAARRVGRSTPRSKRVAPRAGMRRRGAS